MRFVIIGASAATVFAAQRLVEKGHDVVIVEAAKEKIEEFSDKVDCGFLMGDGASPEILQETDPKSVDALICHTGSDQTNILAALVGRSLGIKRVVTSINDQSYEAICIELGIDDLTVPFRAVGRALADMVGEGAQQLEYTTALRDVARLFPFVLEKADEGSVGELGLPGSARVINIYRKDKFLIATSELALQEGDEVIILTDEATLGKLRERFGGGDNGGG